MSVGWNSIKSKDSTAGAWDVLHRYQVRGRWHDDFRNPLRTRMRAQKANADLPGINGNFAKETGRKCIGVPFDSLPFVLVLINTVTRLWISPLCRTYLAANVLEVTGWFQHVV